MLDDAFAMFSGLFLCFSTLTFRVAFLHLQRSETPETAHSGGYPNSLQDFGLFGVETPATIRNSIIAFIQLCDLWNPQIHLASSSKHKIRHYAIGLRFSSEKIEVFRSPSWKQGGQRVQGVLQNSCSETRM